MRELLCKLLDFWVYNAFQATLAWGAILLLRAVAGKWLPVRWRVNCWAALAVVTPFLHQSRNILCYVTKPFIRMDFAIFYRTNEINGLRYFAGYDAFKLRILYMPDPAKAELYEWFLPGDPFLFGAVGLLLGGAAVFFGVQLARYWGLRRRVLRFEPSQDKELLAHVEFFHPFYDTPAPPVYLLPARLFPELNCPCVIGFRHPRLVLIAEQWAALTEEERRAVLFHEAHHVRMRDNWRNFALLLLEAMHWYNPIVRRGLRCLRQDLECLRDAQLAASMYAEEREQYLDAIIAVARRPVKYRSALHSGMLFSSGLGDRVRLLSGDAPGMTVGTVVCTVIAGVVIFMAVWPYAYRLDLPFGYYFSAV